jgi:hypothetical protein
VKFNDSIESISNMPFPFNPKLDQASLSTKAGSSQDVADDKKKDPEKMYVYGPRDTTCSCCEMEIRSGN